MYLSYVQYNEEKGNNFNKDVLVYALSTCGFCKQALKFLREHNIPFKYVYVDLLPIDVRNRLKEDLKNKYDKRVVFPYLIIDGKTVVLGFTQEEWEKELGVK